jgi:hypothetical protein
MNSSFDGELMAAQTRNWNTSRHAVATAIALPAPSTGSAFREMVIVARETAMVLMIQIAFRAALMMRRWNY